MYGLLRQVNDGTIIGFVPADDPVNSLDVAILQNNLLNPVLGIEDPRSDERIDFVGGIRGMGELGGYRWGLSTKRAMIGYEHASAQVTRQD